MLRLRLFLKCQLFGCLLSISTSTRAGFLLSAAAIGVLSGPLLAQGTDSQQPPLTFEYFREIYKRKTEFYVPPENPSTPAKVKLGKVLFFDPRLSGSNSMSCATCHNPALGWSDGLARALGNGGKTLARRTPSLLNVAFSNNLQWDSEFKILEDQALAPIRKKTEMNQDLTKLPAKIKAIKGYAPLFADAFPGEPISNLTIARALAAFERTIVSGISPFERFLNGDDNAMSMEAKLGGVLFHRKARCSSCHMGWTLSDGSSYDIGHKGEDLGVGALTKNAWEKFKFKNPPLLDVASHPPYMHDGALPDLFSVVEFYDRGGDVKRPTLSLDIIPLKLTAQEKAQLVAFLNALTSQRDVFEIPSLPE